MLLCLCLHVSKCCFEMNHRRGSKLQAALSLTGEELDMKGIERIQVVICPCIELSMNACLCLWNKLQTTWIFQRVLDEAAWVCALQVSCSVIFPVQGFISVYTYFSGWFCADLLSLSNLQHSLSHEAKIRLPLLRMDSPSGFHVKLRRRNRGKKMSVNPLWPSFYPAGKADLIVLDFDWKPKLWAYHRC